VQQHCCEQQADSTAQQQCRPAPQKPASADAADIASSSAATPANPNEFLMRASLKKRFHKQIRQESIDHWQS
jgi:hypothetical protein